MIKSFLAGILFIVLLYISLNIYKTYRAVWENRAALIRLIEKVKVLEND